MQRLRFDSGLPTERPTSSGEFRITTPAIFVHMARALRAILAPLGGARAQRKKRQGPPRFNDIDPTAPLQFLTTLHFLRAYKTYTVLVLAVLAAGLYANIKSWSPPSSLVGSDINSVFIEGERIRYGENPYSRTLTGNMADNNKYSTYLPTFYELSALTQTLGLKKFETWVWVWRFIFMIFNVGIFLVLFLALDPKNCPWLALGAAGFWFLNRWTLEITYLSQIDFPAIFFLVLSVVTFRQAPARASYLLGLSLAFKQIAVFVVPLYLAAFWATRSRIVPNRVRELVATSVRIVLIPAIVSFPFVLWDPEGFAKSIFFSFTRNPGTDFIFDVPSAGEVLDFRLPFDHFGLNRQLLRLPMLVFLALSYIATLRGEIRLELGALLAMAIFVGFNPVFFSYYMVWIVPLIPLVARGFWGRPAALTRAATRTIC